MESFAEHLSREGVITAATRAEGVSGGVAEEIGIDRLELFERHDHRERMVELLGVDAVQINAARLLAVLARHEPAAVEWILQVLPDVVFVHLRSLPLLLVPVAVDVLFFLHELPRDLLVRHAPPLPLKDAAPVLMQGRWDDLQMVRVILVINDREGGRERPRAASTEFLLDEATEHIVLQVIGVRLRTGKLHGEMFLA